MGTDPKYLGEIEKKDYPIKKYLTKDRFVKKEIPLKNLSEISEIRERHLEDYNFSKSGSFDTRDADDFSNPFDNPLVAGAIRSYQKRLDMSYQQANDAYCKMVGAYVDLAREIGREVSEEVMDAFNQIGEEIDRARNSSPLLMSVPKRGIDF